MSHLIFGNPIAFPIKEGGLPSRLHIAQLSALSFLHSCFTLLILTCPLFFPSWGKGHRLERRLLAFPYPGMRH